MERVSILLLLMCGAACHFQPSGLPATESPSPDAAPSHEAGADGPSIDGRRTEASAVDLPVAEGPRPDNLAPPDNHLPDLRPQPDSFPGLWYQADEAHCPSFCDDLGRASAAGPEGASCMSGEVRPQSGIDQGITFTYGCLGNCKGQTSPFEATTTVYFEVGYCYKTHQKQNWDNTDKTVGCYCL